MKGFKIGFIGGGNMAEALIRALVAKRVFRPSQILVSEPLPGRRGGLRKRFKVALAAGNLELVQRSQILLLAVKPQQMRGVLKEVSAHVRSDQLVLSIAAGLDTSFFKKHLSAQTRLIRVMPNTPAMIGLGASALYASKTATASNRKTALKIFGAAGIALFVEREEWLDVVTALSGSGPAFVYKFLEALKRGATLAGLPLELTQTLLFQTLVGSVEMARRSKEPLTSLIGKVASKGGTTEAGLQVLEQGDFTRLVEQTIGAAAKRARELREGS